MDDLINNENNATLISAVKQRDAIKLQKSSIKKEKRTARQQVWCYLS